MQRVIDNNRDVVDFVKEQLYEQIEEESEITKDELKERIFAEFKYIRFASRRLVLEVLIAAALGEIRDEREELH